MEPEGFRRRDERQANGAIRIDAITNRTPAETRAGVGMAWRKKGAAKEIATTAVTSANASLVLRRAIIGELFPMTDR